MTTIVVILNKRYLYSWL